ncbi:MAG: hypothetical protein IKL52_05305 [Candidatus Gastranaerophilales bacterium]|nr:hypothetical protein [Candidatus Gastranaerophilales bacterium]
MKINSIQNYNFKGYDAVPLNAIHIQDKAAGAFFWELEEIAKKEGFEVKYDNDLVKWSQDHKTIIERRKRPFVLTDRLFGETSLEALKKKYKISGAIPVNYIAGGNCFIGKLPYGEKWMMVGEEDCYFGKKPIAKDYDIKTKNIIPIPQQDFHLDMFIRPIGYPYVLVNNPELVREKIKELNKDGKYDELEQAFLKKEQERQMEYSSYKKTIKALKKAGFEPIEVAGVFGSGINFMNAIVNQHSNGKMTYITNGTMSLNGKKNIFQEIFEQELRQKAPDIEKVYFINGALDSDSNFLMNELERFDGGLHCMTTEEPNFRMWV